MLIPMSTGLVQEVSGAWDISTAVYNQESGAFALSGAESGLSFNNDGTAVFISAFSSSSTANDVEKYTLGTAWDVGSTATFAGKFDVNNTFSFDCRFSEDGLNCYTVSSGIDRISQAVLSTAFDIAGATSTKLLSVAAQTGNPQGLDIANSDTVAFVTGDSSIFKYTLSTAGDISTGSFSQSFSVSSQTTSPRGIFCKPDGFSIFVVAESTDEVLQYDMTTAFDLSTASYNQSFSVASQVTTPFGLFFKEDGTKMYVFDRSGARINEYDLG